MLTPIRISDKRKTRKFKKARPIKTPRSPEAKYKRDLFALVRRLRSGVREYLIPALRATESDYTRDGYALTLSQVMDRLRSDYVNIGREADYITSKFVGDMDRVNRDRFYAAMNNAIGVDLGSVVSSEGLEDVLLSSTRENVNLIKSIPEEYFKKIETIVYNGTVRKNSASSMIQQIQKLGHSTQKRAKLIARDQSAKLNSALSQQRQINAGVEEYIWRTSEDDRVRESHASKNGKTFRWDDPPDDTGHPGQDIQCRCVAQPIIKI